MAVHFVYSNEVGFVSIPGDPLSQMIDPTEGSGSVPSNYVKTVYEAAYFSVDISIKGKYINPLDGSATYEDAISFVPNYDWSEHGITYTKLSDSSFRLVGPITSAFPDQYYRFTLTDLSSQVLAFDHEAQFYSLNRYKMPNPTKVMLAYPLTVTIPPDPDPLLGQTSNTTEDVDLNQWVFWSFSTAAANIALLRTKGLK